MRTALLSCLLLVLPLAQAAGAELQDEINAAIDRGVKYLQERFPNEASLSNPENNLGIGANALLAWTLLESGVPKTDPNLKKFVDRVRQDIIKNDVTYSLSTAIVLLDRYGDPNDSLLIQALATRLLEAQEASGGWTYNCPEPSKIEQNLLRQYYKKDNDGKNLAIMLQARIQRRNRLPVQLMPDNVATDNSNTQFAIMALWVARRHGVVADRALQVTELRFRFSQLPNGRWDYEFQVTPDGGKTLGMTCAGMIGIALGRATRPSADLAKDLGNDPMVKRGLAAVVKFMEAGLPAVDDPTVNRLKFHGHYGLWSLERMSLIYGLKEIGGKDWYTWGARYLVKNQTEDGSWQGAYEADYAADTCFALLFLRRANPVGDLTKKQEDKKPPPKLLVPVEKGSPKGTSQRPLPGEEKAMIARAALSIPLLDVRAVLAERRLQMQK